MILVPQDLQSLLSAGLWHGVIVFLRISAFVSVLPAFGERTVPMRVKIGIGIAFTLIVAPAVQNISAPQDLVGFAGLIVTEIAIGLALGIAVRLFVLALQTAGSIAAQSTSLSQILGGAAAEPIPAMGYILVVAGLALAVMAGLHIQVAKLMVGSYFIFPAGALPDGRDLSLWGVIQVSQAFSLAFMLAAPFVITSILYNVALGVINRAMPQLMVAFVGAPVITFGGLFLLLVCTPLMLTVWIEAMQSFFQNPMSPQR